MIRGTAENIRFDLTTFQRSKLGCYMPVTQSQLLWATPKDKNLTGSSKCLSPNPFLLFSSRDLYITNHMGPADAGLLCSGYMKPWCGLGLPGRKAELSEQIDKTRSVSRRCWVCPGTGFQQVQLFIKDGVCQPGTSAPSAGVLCAHQKAPT